MCNTTSYETHGESLLSVVRVSFGDVNGCFWMKRTRCLGLREVSRKNENGQSGFELETGKFHEMKQAMSRQFGFSKVIMKTFLSVT